MIRATALLLLAAAAASAESLIAEGASQPQLAVDADGTFYCTFLRAGNVELSVSSDGGKTWSPPVVAIDAGGSARGGMQRGPRIGVDDGKRVTITAPLCFDEAERKNKYPKSELWIVTSSDGGKTFPQPTRVNDVEKSAAEALHQLAVAPSGEIHVTWLDDREGKGQQVWYAQVSEGKVGRNVKLTGAVCPCCAPGLGLDGKGNPYVAFREGDDGTRQIFLTLSRDGGKTFVPPAQVNRKDSNVEG